MKTSPVELAFKDRFKTLSEKELSKKAFHQDGYIPPAAISRVQGHFIKSAHLPDETSALSYKDVYFFDTSAKNPKWKPAKILTRSPEGMIKIEYQVTKSDANSSDRK